MKLKRQEPGFTLSPRLACFIGTLLFVVSFHWSYVVWLNPTWEYMGFLINDTVSSLDAISCYVVCCIPLIWMPLVINRSSKLVYWYLYLMMYIPMIFSLHFSVGALNYVTIGATVLGFWCMNTSYLFKLLRIESPRIGQSLFWAIFLTMFFLFLFYIVLIYKDNLSFVNPFSSEDVYNLRFKGYDVGAGTLVGYPIMISSGCLVPFAFMYGLICKKRGLIILSLVASVILYMTAANKAFLFMLPFMVLNYFFLKRKSSYYGFKIQLLYGSLTVLLTALQVFFGPQISLLTWEFSSAFLLRTLGVCAYTTTMYVPFFETHPLTYYSHVGLISKFVADPYNGVRMGNVIGEFVTGSTLFNANATFFLTDGLAAIGSTGLIFIGLIASFMFWITDIVSAKFDTKFTASILTSVAMNLSNASLFTVILSCGWFLIILFFYLLSPQKTSAISKQF